MILAAGLGTRLRPWTLSHPKALVPVAGIPMLRRVIDRLCDAGACRIVVNVHHFADQIESYLAAAPAPVPVIFSDERDLLLDTGGGVMQAFSRLPEEARGMPLLVHNVDILSDADLASLYGAHTGSGADITLLVSDRQSSRSLLFDPEGSLAGWRDNRTGAERLRGSSGDTDLSPFAFSGIYVISPRAVDAMHAAYPDATPFSVIDFMLGADATLDIRCRVVPGLSLVDIGKPDTLRRANLLLDNHEIL